MTSFQYLSRYSGIAVAVATLAACAGDVTSVDGGNPIATPPASTPELPVSGNPIAGAKFWVDPNSSAKQTADSWRQSRPADAAQMDKIASGSQAQWFGEWSGDIFSAVSNAVNAVASAGAVPVLVAYNVPQRDCGGLSAGGVGSPAAYKTWISAFANALAGKKAVVILEPDAITQMDCLSATDQATRMSLMQYAVAALKGTSSNVAVYLDGGHSAWLSPSDEAERLKRANVAGADGFALNVSNFQYTSNLIAYGKSVSALVGGKHFVIDTSRNGLGPTADNQWCNPAGRALGPRPTTLTADPLVDAYLWIKAPGESDGSCNGAPPAGEWWAEYALGLAQRGTI
ncbi:MAG: glycoside hydrolase family 6 protein [Gemmatimonadaceae bacterium]